MKHNGVEYKEETLCDVTRYDGGAMGGIVMLYPNGFYRFLRDTYDTFEMAANAAQNWQRKQYETQRAFVMQYEKEART